MALTKRQKEKGIDITRKHYPAPVVVLGALLNGHTVRLGKKRQPWKIHNGKLCMVTKKVKPSTGEESDLMVASDPSVGWLVNEANELTFDEVTTIMKLMGLDRMEQIAGNTVREMEQLHAAEEEEKKKKKVKKQNKPAS